MKLRVVVAFGGASVEHEISILSALQVMAVLEEHYEVIPLYIARNKQMYSDACLRDLHVYKDLQGLCERLPSVHLHKENARQLLVSTARWKRKRKKEFDIVMPILHGTNGEDGSFQGYLRTLDIPFTGCDVLGGALGQDKASMKLILQAKGLPIVSWVTLGHDQQEQAAQQAKQLGYPLIVKPSRLGSSIGIHIVREEEMLAKALRDAFVYDDVVIMEKLVEPMREINCAVLGNGTHARVSVLEEVMHRQEILSFADKYEHGQKGMAGISRQVPADITAEQTAQIQAYALSCFQALQAEGVCRIDFLMNSESGAIYINEINTIPGSLAGYLWERSGLPFTALLDELLRLGKERYRRQQQLLYAYDTNILARWDSYGNEKLKLMK